MTRKMKRKIAGTLLLLCVAGGIAFELLCHTRTWSYPDPQIVASSPSIQYHLFQKLVFAAVVSFVLVVTARCAGRGLEGLIFAAIAQLLLVCTVWHVWEALEADRQIDLAQQCVLALYVPICYGIARWVKAHVAPWWTACAVFVALHLSLVAFCGWNTLCKVFFFGPAMVVWMAVAFFLVYEAEFWGVEGVRWRQRLGRYIGVVSAHVMAFSLHRVVSILSPLWGGGRYGWLNDGAEWWKLRMDMLTGQLTGSFTQLIEDRVSLSNLRLDTLAWLRVAFGEGYQLAYVVLWVVALVALWHLCRGCRVGDDPVARLLATGALISNVWGMACELNLFWSARVGTLVSVNPFQLVPLACLAVWGIRSCVPEDEVVLEGEVVLEEEVIDHMDTVVSDYGLLLAEGVPGDSFWGFVPAFTPRMLGNHPVSFLGWVDEDPETAEFPDMCYASLPAFAMDDGLQKEEGFEGVFYYTDDDLLRAPERGGWSSELVEELRCEIVRYSVGVVDVRVWQYEDGGRRIVFGLGENGNRCVASGGQAVPVLGMSVLVIPKSGEFESEIGVMNDGLAEVLFSRSFCMK